MKRTLYNVAVLIGIFFLPWWVSFSLLVLGFLAFEMYSEGIMFGFLIDIMYGAPRGIYEQFVFMGFYASMVLFFVSDIIKRKLRIYDAY